MLFLILHIKGMLILMVSALNKQEANTSKLLIPWFFFYHFAFMSVKADIPVMMVSYLQLWR